MYIVLLPAVFLRLLVLESLYWTRFAMLWFNIVQNSPSCSTLVTGPGFREVFSDTPCPAKRGFNWVCESDMVLYSGLSGKLRQYICPMSVNCRTCTENYLNITTRLMTYKVERSRFEYNIKLQSNLDISNSDISNSAKFEASIWIKNTYWLLSPTIIWRWRLFYKSKLPEVQINLHFG